VPRFSDHTNQAVRIIREEFGDPLNTFGRSKGLISSLIMILHPLYLYLVVAFLRFVHCPIIRDLPLSGKFWLWAGVAVIAWTVIMAYIHFKRTWVKKTLIAVSILGLSVAISYWSIHQVWSILFPSPDLLIPR
jgi:hypothetical protein